MNENLFYKVKKYGNILLYKYDDTIEFNINEKINEQIDYGICINNIYLKEGSYIINFNLVFSDNNSEIYLFKNIINYNDNQYKLLNGQNSINIQSNDNQLINLYFFIKGNNTTKFKLINLNITKCNNLTIVAPKPKETIVVPKIKEEVVIQKPKEEINKTEKYVKLFGMGKIYNSILRFRNSKTIKYITKKSNINEINHIKIFNYTSTTNSKCYFIENINGILNITKIKKTVIKPNIKINHMFVTTHNLSNDFFILLFNENDKISIGKIEEKIEKEDYIKNECMNMSLFNDIIINYKNNNNNSVKLKVLGLLDEFSKECFSYEVELTELSKNNINTINQYDFDFFLCESAWHGYLGQWTGYLPNFEGTKDVTLRNFIKNLKIPKIFYGKEDPINFNTFKNCAKYFNNSKDLIVTTDSSIIQEYKNLGCINVESFPFCCQPIIHNPVNRIDNNKIIFPCAWYGVKYPERCKDMETMISSLMKYNIDIYDRRYLFNRFCRNTTNTNIIKYKDTYLFPKKYDNIIKGQLTYLETLNKYKQYGIVLNTNTITDSETMFSRRVIEASACGCVILSNKSVGMKIIFNETYTEYNSENVNNIINNREYRNIIQYKNYTKVMRNYTYERLINLMSEISLNKKQTNKKKILILYFYNDTYLKYKTHHYIIYLDINKYNNICVDEYDYVYIMGKWFNYSSEYIENSIIPFSFTNCKIVGKSCYVQKNDDDEYLVGEHTENTFSNKLHIFSLVFNIKNNNLYIFNGNIYNNILNYLRNLNKNDCYSSYKYDFVDNCSFYDFMFDLKIKVNTNNINALIMCNWKRTDNLINIINNLENQDSDNFIYCIWNNNYDDSLKIYDIVKKSKISNKIFQYDSFLNIGGFGRFIFAKYLLNNFKKIENVMFFDDDQIIPLDFVDKFEKNITDCVSLNYYGRKFVIGMPYVIVNSDDSLNNAETKKCIKNIDIGEKYDYGGTGGMCVKLHLFNKNEIYKIPLKYIYCEDMWLSWIIYKHNMDIIKFDIDIKGIRDSHNQCNQLWETKIEFLTFIRKLGWNV